MRELKLREEYLNRLKNGVPSRRDISPRDNYDLDSLLNIGIPRLYQEAVFEDFEFSNTKSGNIAKEVISNYLDNLHDVFDSCVNLLIYGKNGRGKAMPMYSKILSKNGWTTMGDLKVGDEIYSRNGKLTKVLALFPQGEKDCYKVNMLDGRSAYCCDEHLWACYTTRGNLKNFTLREMMDKGFKNDVNNSYRFFIPNNECIDYGGDIDLPIHPYIMGVLLGDGCMAPTQSGVVFSSVELDIVAKMRNILGNGYNIHKLHADNCSWSITYNEDIRNNPLKIAIKKLDLVKKSAGKFIPTVYLRASKEQRMELLMGLMDTDGSFQDGRNTFSSISKELIDNFMELCRSLGYQCSMKLADRTREGKGIEYRVAILTGEKIFSSLKHTTKYDVYSKRQFKNKSKYFKSAIKDVEYVGREVMQCILVDDPSHLYLTDDFIVTHNTYTASLIIKRAFEFYYTSRLYNYATIINNVYSKIDNAEDYANYEFLCIDEVGKETQVQSKSNIFLLEQILRLRDQKGLPTIVCTNLDYEQFKNMYGDSITSLLSQGAMIQMEGKDRRGEVIVNRDGFRKVMGWED